MKTRRRDIEVFSLSFLDVICCAFGAIILLFVLSKFAEPVIIEEVSRDLQSVIDRLEKELHEIRGETAVLNRELQGKKEQLSEEKKKLARAAGRPVKYSRRICGIRSTRPGAKHHRGKDGQSPAAAYC